MDDTLRLMTKNFLLTHWYTSTIRQGFHINSIRVGSVDVSSAGEARNLRMWLDSKLTFVRHVEPHFCYL